MSEAGKYVPVELNTPNPEWPVRARLATVLNCLNRERAA